MVNDNQHEIIYLAELGQCVCGQGMIMTNEEIPTSCQAWCSKGLACVCVCVYIYDCSVCVCVCVCEYKY